MLRHKVNEIPEREVTIWLEREKIPHERYQNLSPNNKFILHNLVCIPTRIVSDKQKKNLYRELCLPDIAGRESIDPADFIPREEIDRFFTPIAPSETLSDYEKY